MVNNDFNERPNTNEKIDSINYLKKMIVDTKKSGDIDGAFKLEEILRIIHNKKYGLVWEKHLEKVEEEMKTKIPVFIEEKQRQINDNKNSDIYNFLLEGDNLHSLHLLEKTHEGKIDVIYIDPPYNTGTKKGAFRYNDNLILKDDAYIHSKWLSFMNVRLLSAKKLLTPDGVIFMHIDENEYAQAKLLMDEVFGENAFVENIIWNKRVPKNDKGIGSIHEYILVYTLNTKNKFTMEKDELPIVFGIVDDAKKKEKTPLEAQNELKEYYKEQKKQGHKLPRAITLYNCVDNDYEVFGKINMSWPNANTFGYRYDVIHPITKKPVKIPARGWRWSESTLKKALRGKLIKLDDGSYIKGRIWFAKDENTQISSIKYLKNADRMLLRSIISLKSDGSLELEKLGFSKKEFPYAKPVTIAKKLIESITHYNKNATVLDFFAGSGTTGQAVNELNNEDGGKREFILATNNENNIARKLTYERLKRISSGTKKYNAIPLNLKYLKTDFVNKNEFPGSSLEDELMKYITPLVELEFGVDINNPEVQIILNEDQLDELLKNNKIVKNSILFMNPDVFLDDTQIKKLFELNVTTHDIPNYFFGKDMWS